MKRDYDLFKIVLSGLLINNSWQNLLPFILVAVMVALVADSQLHPAHSFFQSPAQSPVLSAPTDTPLPPTDTPTPLPTNTPVLAQPQPQPIDTPTPAPALEANPVVEAQSSEPQLPQAIPNIPNIPTANQQQEQLAPPTQLAQEQPTPLAPVEPTIVTGSDTEDVEAPASGVVVNQAALIDIIVQWVASLWLCIGVGVILLIPLIFIFLQVRGTRLRR